jgi:hypothetical protein
MNTSNIINSPWGGEVMRPDMLGSGGSTSWAMSGTAVADSMAIAVRIRKILFMPVSFEWNCVIHITYSRSQKRHSIFRLHDNPASRVRAGRAVVF